MIHFDQSLTQANGSIRRESHFTGDIWSYQPYEQLPTVYMLLPRAAFEADPDWYYSFEYLAENIDQGMLPNRFPDADEKPEYNTVDATFWFFVAAYKYYLYSRDQTFLKEILLPAMAEMSESGIGQISEIFDGDAPTCPAVVPPRPGV